MYRQGLGDCFLLATRAKDPPQEVRYLLIDCGVHMRQTDGTERLLQVMNHLAASTGNHLDVVVATHEHADHLSGFAQKGSPFLRDSLTLDSLWVGWTEKVGDQQADKLREKHGTAREVIEKAVEQARDRAGVGLANEAELLHGLTDFERPAEGSFDRDQVEKAILAFAKDSPDGEAALAMFDKRLTPAAAGLGAAATSKPKKASSNELALALLAMKAQASQAGHPGGPTVEPVVYCDPQKTKPLGLPGVPELRAYVLGPPRDDALLKKDLPTKIRGSGDGHHGEFKEVYLSGSSQSLALRLSPVLEVEHDGHTIPPDLRFPFVTKHRRRYELTKQGWRWQEYPEHGDQSIPTSTKEFFQKHYSGNDRRPKDDHPPADWRRIDGDWLGAAEQLALNLDSDTNNTSLALAFEWGPPGKGLVLLFPGDAQVGNWLSWRDQTYPAGNKRTSADELVSRTVLYKVGHHGSHNATVKCDPRDTSTHEIGAPFGLELMDDIIALIPVDRAAADKKMPNPWKMPHLPLYRRLREKARRRVLRADQSLAPLEATDDPDLVPQATDWKAVPGLRGVRWRASAEQFDMGTPGPLYYDILFPLPEP